MKTGLFLASLILIAAPAFGDAAPDQPQADQAKANEVKARAIARSKLPSNLRGSLAAPISSQSPAVSVGSRGAALPKPSTSLALASPLPAAKPDIGQCRTDCAHSYYFCLSGQITAECADTWSQCQVSCSHPPIGLDR